MGAFRIVLHPPLIDYPPNLNDASKHVRVQYFAPEGAIESFNVRILCWFAGFNPAQFHFVRPTPTLQLLADELGAIIRT